MFRRLGFVILTIGLTLPATAAERPGSISGYVRDATGVPQMGAVVEILGSAIHTLKVFTDDRGFYSAQGLLPGVYSIKVSAPAFLPALRERIGLHAGGSVIVNLTLNTLFEAVQLGPMRGPVEEDDWKWVLRTVANRPILRVLEDGSVGLRSEKSDHDLKGALSFVAGSASAGYGSTSGLSTGFTVEKSLFSSSTVGLTGNVGYGTGTPGAVVRASYIRKLSNGSEPQLALTMRRLASPDASLRNAALQAFAFTASDNFTFGNFLELRIGSEMQTIQFMGRVSAFRPFGSADLHLSPNTVLEYRYASSLPDTRLEKGFDTAPADLSESGPRMSIAGFVPTLERARHQELALSRKFGKNNMQVAFFSDQITNPALTGIGDLATENGDVLPDLYSNSFTYRGKDLDTHGLRIVFQRKLASDLTATFDYEFGGVLDLNVNGLNLQDAREAMTVRNQQSIAAKLRGKIPHTRAGWMAAYRWTSGSPLTPVDMFNASPGQADPFLSVFIRQPIPRTGFLPGRMDAVIDVRNLLAQGYVPVLAQDGHTVFLVQSARAVRGGLAFTF